MLRIKNSFCLALLFVNALAFARTTPCPGEFGIAAEWLYMLPAYNQPYFAASRSEFNDTIGFDVCPNDHHFHSGYRIDLIYGFCNCIDEIRFRWTHFPTFSDSTSLEDPNGTILALAPPFGEADSGVRATWKDTFRFYYLDFLLGWHAIDCCPFLLTLQGGLQYANLRYKAHGEVFEEIFEEDDIISQALVDQTVNYCSHFSGVGPEIGAEFSFCFWNCFSLNARSYASLLINKMHASEEMAFLQDTDIFTKTKDYWHVVPFTNIRAGLAYSRPIDMSCWGCGGCLNFDIEVGYEAMWLFNGLEAISLLENEQLLIDRLMTFSLNGPYLHVGVTF